MLCKGKCFVLILFPLQLNELVIDVAKKAQQRNRKKNHLALQLNLHNSVCEWSLSGNEWNFSLSYLILWLMMEPEKLSAFAIWQQFEFSVQQSCGNVFMVSFASMATNNRIDKNRNSENEQQKRFCLQACASRWRFRRFMQFIFIT